TLKELVSLEDIRGADKYLPEIVRECGSFLTLRDSKICFVHQSAKDFLQVSGEIFPSGMKEQHHSIFSRSLDIMSPTLRRDIYGLSAPGYPIENVKPPDPDPLGRASYACVYWADHLDESTCSGPKHQDDFQDGGKVDSFLREKYIYWLEALSLLRRMP